MNFLPDDIDKYVLEHTQNEPELLNRLSRETWEKVLNPRMLSGPLQGRVLSMVSHIIAPKHILEIGTFTGYSTLCFAEGLPENGHIDTIDINEELEPITTKYFEESEFKNKITRHYGNAIDLIPTIDKDFDMVFIDADKSNYINYYNMMVDKLKSGAIIIIDNVLWNGKVVEEVNSKDIDTKTIIELNKLVQEDDRVQNVLFPIRDGMMMVRKL